MKNRLCGFQLGEPELRIVERISTLLDVPRSWVVRRALRMFGFEGAWTHVPPSEREELLGITLEGKPLPAKKGGK